MRRRRLKDRMLPGISMPVGHFLLASKKNIPKGNSCETFAAVFLIRPLVLIREIGVHPPEKESNVGSRRGHRHAAHRRRDGRRARDVRPPGALRDHRDHHRARDLLHAEVPRG